MNFKGSGVPKKILEMYFDTIYKILVLSILKIDINPIWEFPIC